MPTVYKRAAAKRDLVENYVYLAEHAGIETAERFLSSANESFNDLAPASWNGNMLILARSEAGEFTQMAGQRI